MTPPEVAAPRVGRASPRRGRPVAGGERAAVDPVTLRLLAASVALCLGAGLRSLAAEAAPCRGQVRLPQRVPRADTQLADVGCIQPRLASWRDWAQVAELPVRTARRLQRQCQGTGGPGDGVACASGADLADVRGVGPATAARIRPLLCRWPPAVGRPP